MARGPAVKIILGDSERSGLEMRASRDRIWPKAGCPSENSTIRAWGDWRLIFIAERSGLPVRLERHRAERRAGWPHPGSCPAGDGAAAGLRW